MKKGIYTISAEQYHADKMHEEPSLSNSIAKILIQQSPQHAWYAHSRLNPDYVSDDSSRFDLGSAAHAVLLENDYNKINFVEADDWRTKEAKSQRDAARARGILPVLKKYELPLKEMVRVAKHKIENSELAGIFNNGKAEQTLFWQEGEIYCRARLDFLRNDQLVILDYKTTETAEPEACVRKIGQMGYDIQASFYKRGLVACGGSENAVFVFLFQEIEPPYACCLIALSNTYIEIADEKVNRAIDMWTESMASNRWPSYSSLVHYAEPPAWVMQQHMNMMEAKENE